jgi:hypothetical protein
MIRLRGLWYVLPGAKMSEADDEHVDYECRDAVLRCAKYNCSVIFAVLVSLFGAAELGALPCRM